MIEHEGGRQCSYLQLVQQGDAELYAAASASTGIGVDVIAQAPADPEQAGAAAQLYAEEGDSKRPASELLVNDVHRVLSDGGALLRLTATRSDISHGWSWHPIHQAVRAMRAKRAAQDTNPFSQ